MAPIEEHVRQMAFRGAERVGYFLTNFYRDSDFLTPSQSLWNFTNHWSALHLRNALYYTSLR